MASAPVASLVGREQELAAVQTHLAGAREGRGRLVLVTGDAGIGKTRLADEVASIAADEGFVVAWVQCAPVAEAPPYWPWRQLVKQVWAHADIAPETDHLEQLRHLLDLDHGRGDGERVAQPAPWVMVDEVARSLALSSRVKPLLLVIEDLESADEASLTLLRYLVPNLRAERTLVLGTFDEVAARKSSTSNVLHALARECPLLSLNALHEVETSQLLKQFANDDVPPALVAAIHDASGGNPLFIRETTRLLRSRGDIRRPDHSLGFRVPDGIKDLIRQRLVGLAPETRVLLSVAAIVGRRFEVRLLSDMAKVPQPDAIELLEAAAEEHLVEATDAIGTYAFSHVLVRETLYEDLPAFKRMELHRAAAEALERLGLDTADDRLPELAHHWFKSAQAGDPVKALSYAHRAADRAADTEAYEEAVRLYQRALKVADQAGADGQLVRDLQDRLDASMAAAAQPRRDGVPREETLFAPSASAETTARQIFRCEGDYWTLSFGGRVCRLRGVKGMRYLAHLLDNPHREIHALDLVGAVDAQGAAREPVAESGELSVGTGEIGPLLDAKAKAAYKARLDELRAESEEADAFNDPERAARAREEIHALVQQLSQAVGLHGRDRAGTSPAERARVAVTKAIRDAMRKIAGAHPPLAEHLQATVRTGLYCSYKPDPRIGIRWMVK